MGVSAVTSEKLVRGFHGFEQMKRTNRTSGTKRLVAVARNYDGRPVVALDDTSRGDADHAAMPPLAIDHNAVGFAQRRIASHALLDQAQNPPLFFLALGV